jgi:diguanylate cyclase (GGDEF)-like protein
MQGLPPVFHNVRDLILRGIRSVRKHDRILTARLRLGITSRLLFGFVGVGALVLSASFLVEQTVRVEKTIERTRVEIVAPKPAAPVPQAPVVINEPAPVPAAVRVVQSDLLMAAISRYGRAVIGRVAVHTIQTESELDQSNHELDRTLAEFMLAARSISANTESKRITAAVNAYKVHGADFVFTADNRRTVAASYTNLFEALNARAQRSLDGGWKIFGRVVARQSLLSLSADLDTLRQSALALGNDDQLNPEVISSLEKNENALSGMLEANEKAFRRSEGDAWYETMHTDFVKLVASRKFLVDVTQQLREAADQFNGESGHLAKSIPPTIEQHVRPAPKAVLAPKVAQDPSATVAEARPAAPGPAVETAIEPPPPVVTTQSVTTQSEPNADRHLFAWVSAAAILLLIYICLSTILSVVRPVRRLMAATLRLANGETSVQVALGGVKELDTLAGAFNTMAGELSKARAHLEDKVAERTQQLQELAEHDPLTGLPNRRHLFELLNKAIKSAEENGHLVGVFFLDVDNFKYINDSLGHAYGDRVLVSLATRLTEAAGPHGFAARLGGDEFTVILDRAATLDDVRAAGLEIVNAFQRPLSVDGRDLSVSVSVGASIFPDHESDVAALLQAADAALFRAKKLGRSQLSIFTPDLLETAAANFATEQGLRRAIERGEFELAFQPEISVETLETSLVEALIRWRMPDGRLATPDEFLGVAEEAGLIVPISDWVVRSAIEAAAHWHHGAWPDARVAINVSPRQLFDHHFVDRLQELLDQYRLPATCIEIELTESVLQTGPTTIEALRRLRAKGIAIALDDFGTGYSSLSSLEQLPLTRIKLDRSLIAGIDTSARSAAITRAMIGMCQGLGLEITAEGVERPEQFHLLLGNRGMYLQGYLFSPAVSRDELVPLMAQISARAQELVLTATNIRNAPVLELFPRQMRRSAPTPR